jgi:hypothetical protein
MKNLRKNSFQYASANDDTTLTSLQIGDEVSAIPDDLDKITFEYKISPNYTVYAVTGCHGGLNAQSQIVMNFFNERAAIPKSEVYEIDSAGNLGHIPIEVNKVNSVIRDVLLGVSFNVAVARVFAQCLNEKADLFENNFKPDQKRADS